MNRSSFFEAARSGVFAGRLSQSQVDGIETLLDEIETHAVPLQQAAYILAGVFHETGAKMIPVREGFAKTDAGARAAVASLYRKGRIKTNYAEPINGVSYYGRGRIQNTWYRNYRKLEERFGKPFIKSPDLLLDDATDAEVTVVGHIEGIWTGKKLSDFITDAKADYYNARRIVNGTDKAAQIAVYAKSFEKALRLAGYGGGIPFPDHVPVTPEPKPAAKAGGIAALIGAALLAAGAWLSSIPCNLFGFCG